MSNLAITKPGQRQPDGVKQSSRQVDLKPLLCVGGFSPSGVTDVRPFVDPQ
jgi:hypothetical protein